VSRKRIDGITPPATLRQLEVMRVLRRTEQETGAGVTQTELHGLIGGGAVNMLRTLEGKGWSENEQGRWHLTDEGIDQLEGAPELPPEPQKKPTPSRKPTALSLPRNAPSVPPTHWSMTAAEAIDAVAAEYGVTREELVGRSRMQRFVNARQAAMVRLRSLGFSYPEIALLLGRDHTTVVAACHKIAALEAAE
jgi:hypothetical protein